MDVFQQYAEVTGWQETVVAIGNFDGVHIGHQALLGATRDLAGSSTVPTVVLTFHPHPMTVVAPHRQLKPLTSLGDRLSLLAHYGVDGVLAQAFDGDFAALSAGDFIQRVLVDALRVKGVVVGFNFGFGAGRTGNLATLRAAGRQFGFELGVVDSVTHSPGESVSSSRIRKAVACGDLEAARRMLGRPHFVTGRVVQGDQRGRTMGFPTVNIQPEIPALPPNGVYAGWLDTGRDISPAVANMGTRPTFGASDGASLEVHALETQLPNLYGQRVRFYFEEALRMEKSFPTKEALIAQIKLDCDGARSVLGAGSAPAPFGL